MQLNSQSLNSNTANRQLDLKLAIYDHKMAMLHQDIFIFGKSLSQIQTQSSLYKFNTLSFCLEKVHTLNPPCFEQFIMFTFQQNLYFWGKTQTQSLNQLYSFDGLKYNKLNQNGPIPNIQYGCTNCFFSNNFLLVFGYFYKDQYFDTWYVLNITTKQWKQAKSNISIPFSQKSSLVWINGKGYLFLTGSFDTKKKQYKNNSLYEISFKSFKQLFLKCEEIQIPNQILNQNIVCQDIFTFNDKYLMIMGKEQTNIQNILKQNYFTYSFFNFDLQTFKLSLNPVNMKIKGQYGEIICYENLFFYVGGIHHNKLVEQIQILNYNIIEQIFSQNKNISQVYEQSRCYNCEQAFTYTQNLIYQPYVKRDYKHFLIKQKIQMKFYKKLSLLFVSDFQAVGLLMDFMKQRKCKEILISLKEEILQTKQLYILQKSINKQVTAILCLEGFSQKVHPIQQIKSFYSYQFSNMFNNNYSNTYLEFSKLIMASSKIGIGLLFVTFTQQSNIFVGYLSYSSTQFPQLNIKSFSKLYYTINLKSSSKQNKCSSLSNRLIIFQNVSSYFSNPSLYQKIESFSQIKSGIFPQYIYVIGTSNLQKNLRNQEFSLNYHEDIVLKDRKKNDSYNSLQKYLMHLYLTQHSILKIQNRLLRFKSIVQIYQNLQKGRYIKLITVKQEKTHKNELDQTHFSTGHEDTISWKKIDEVEKWILYSINSNKITKIDNYYHGVFIYHEKRLIKVINLKHKIVCGVVQMINHTQIMLNKTNFSQKSQERKLKKWLEQIQESVLSCQRYYQV